MSKALPVFAALALMLFGCKHQYWTMVSPEEGETVAASETTPEPGIKQPEPEVTPPTPKQVIYILGIDGMD